MKMKLMIELLTYKYSLIAEILVPIICTLSMSLSLCPSLESLQQSITTKDFSYSHSRRRHHGQSEKNRNLKVKKCKKKNNQEKIYRKGLEKKIIEK